IATVNRAVKNGQGAIYIWDGTNPQPVRKFNLNSQGAMAIAIDPSNEIPYVLDANGVILRYTGDGFEEVSRFPYEKFPLNVDSANNDRYVHPNGVLFTKDGTLLSLINNRNYDTTYGSSFSFPSSNEAVSVSGSPLTEWTNPQNA